MDQDSLKKQLRSEFIKKRSRLSKEEVTRKSKKITEYLLGEKDLINARKVGIYYPANNEVNTEYIFNYLSSHEIATYFPRVHNSGLMFCKVRELDELVSGSYGIAEPGKNERVIKKTELDLVLVPGVVFDKCGSRIGYGKGYYDRFLNGIDERRIYGLSYYLQIAPELPAAVHDIKMGKIVTEMGVIKCEKARRK